MALRLLSVSCRYGSAVALDGVSLHVRRGDCYGFLGHNGAGKTTALRIALGLMRPAAGRVLVDGFDIAAHPAEARARVGGVIETTGFHASLSGLENLVLLARLQGISARDAGAEAGRVLDVVGLGDTGRKAVGAYSQGMRQRLGLAQALLGSPSIVLLDEPTNGLDPEGIEEMRQVLQRLTRDEGTTVLLSSHQLHEVSGICTRIGILRQGRLLLESETESLLAGDRYELRATDTEAARSALASLGFAAAGTRDGTLLVDPGAVAPTDLLRQLVAAGLEIDQFAPRPPTLEEIYLRVAAEAAAVGVPPAPPVPPPAVSAAPATRIAPPRPVARMLRYELARWTARAGVPLLLALPAVVGAAAVLFRRAKAEGFAADVAEGRVVSTTDVTAFEGIGVGLGAGLPVAAFVLAALASQSIAAERARDTLRNVVLRPLRREHAAAGKALGALVAAGACYALLVLVAWGVSAAAFDFTDVTELLPNGERFTLLPADELYPELRRTLLGPLPALAAFTAIGFAAGAASRSAVGGLGMALGSVLLLDLARAPLRGFGVESWMPAAYLPSPFGDTSIVRHFVEASRGVSNTSFAFEGTALLVPLAWAVLGFLVAGVLLRRRAIR